MQAQQKSGGFMTGIFDQKHLQGKSCLLIETKTFLWRIQASWVLEVEFEVQGVLVIKRLPPNEWSRSKNLVKEPKAHIFVRFLFLCWGLVSVQVLDWRWSSLLPSSFSSFLASSSGASAAAPPLVPPLGAAAAPPPPDPTFNSRSLTFLPSSAYWICWRADDDPYDGSDEWHPMCIPLQRALSILARHHPHLLLWSGFEACPPKLDDLVSLSLNPWSWRLTVRWTSASARIREAYETASSELDMIMAETK